MGWFTVGVELSKDFDGNRPQSSQTWSFVRCALGQFQSSPEASETEVMQVGLV